MDKSHRDAHITPNQYVINCGNIKIYNFFFTAFADVPNKLGTAHFVLCVEGTRYYWFVETFH